MEWPEQSGKWERGISGVAGKFVCGDVVPGGSSLTCEMKGVGPEGYP